MTHHVEIEPRLSQEAPQQQPDESKPTTPEQTLVRVQIALALLPLLTACIYLFGMTWHMGYLGVFHVDSSDFPLSTEQTLLMGASALITDVMPWLVYPPAILAALIILGLLIILAFRWLTACRDRALASVARWASSERLLKVLQTVFKYVAEPHEVKWLTPIFEAAFTWYLRWCYVMTICAAVLIQAHYSQEDGKKSAQDQIEKMESGTYASANQLSYAKHPEGVSALRIICNATQCAFWTKADGTIYLRHDQIDSVTIPPKPTEGKTGGKTGIE